MLSDSEPTRGARAWRALSILTLFTGHLAALVMVVTAQATCALEPCERPPWLDMLEVAVALPLLAPLSMLHTVEELAALPVPVVLAAIVANSVAAACLVHALVAWSIRTAIRRRAARLMALAIREISRHDEASR